MPRTLVVYLSASFAFTLLFVMGFTQDATLNASAGAGAQVAAAPSQGGTQVTPLGGGSQAPVSAATSFNTLRYYGGPVLQHVNVVPVYWNSKVALQNVLNSFYLDLPSSSHFNILFQYSRIGLGTRGTPVVFSESGASVTDLQIQGILKNAISKGKLPAPSANTYYPVHFPAGTQITAKDGGVSCVDFCSYHSTTKFGAVNVNYGVIPGMDIKTCQAPLSCVSVNPLTLDYAAAILTATTKEASRELFNATTDPAAGLATTLGPPLAWKGPNEIGDTCTGSQVVVANGHSYAVEREWSNSQNACVTP